MRPVPRCNRNLRVLERRVRAGHTERVPARAGHRCRSHPRAARDSDGNRAASGRLKGLRPRSPSCARPAAAPASALAAGTRTSETVAPSHAFAAWSAAIAATLTTSRPANSRGSWTQEAIKQSCRRVWLITTNDNLNALRFYQRRGMRPVAVHRGAVDEARRIKPTVSLTGDHGIPIRDELEFELVLD
jgi:hypothetical protein